MPHGYRALCSDFYINHRLSLKMDLPLRRDTVLSMFDRIRRERPGMDRFRRYAGELALESGARASEQQWVAVKKTSVRSGSVNPEETADAHALHRLVLDAAPYFLDISALDVDHVEVLYGFDLRATGNHDRIVHDALLAGSPIAALADLPGAVPIDAQPSFGIAFGEACDVQAHVEVKTRTSVREVRTGEFRDEPISVYLTVRRYGPFDDVRTLGSRYDELVARAESLIDERVAPSLLTPLREAIAPGNF